MYRLTRLEGAWPLLAVLPVLLTAGCVGEDRTGSWDGTITDSAGVAVVRNPVRGLWSDAQRWDVEEQFSVGVASGNPDLEFGYISALDIGSDGSIFLLDRQASQIRVLDSTGAAQHTIAGPGSGPGELRPGTSTLVIGSADTVFVPDPLAKRIHAYLPSGESAGDLPFSTGNGIAVSWAVLPTGDLLYRFFSVRWDGLLHYSRSGLPPDTLLRFVYPPPLAELGGDPGTGTFRMTFNPLMVLPAWTRMTDGRIAIGTTDAYRISVVGPDGTVERIIAGPRGRRAVTAPDEQAIADLLARQQDARGVPQQIRDVISLALPDSFPAFASLMAGPEATLWVQQIAEPADMDPGGLGETSYELLGSKTWDVFDREGRFLGPITLPYPMRLLRARGDLLYGVTKGPYDEDKVVRLRVLREPNLPTHR